MGNRSTFSVEYKKELTKLITERGKKVTHVAKDIAVSEAAVRRWGKY